MTAESLVIVGGTAAGLTVGQLDLAYAPLFSPVWDPVAIAAREAAKLV